MIALGCDHGGYNLICAIKKYHIYGVQFHPESIMTPNGITILKNFIKEI